MLYQVSTIHSLMRGEYDGLVSVRTLLEHGDTGIGTFTGVDGELVMLDGHVYRASADGTVTEADADDGVPFAAVCFAAGDAVSLPDAASLEELRRVLDARIDKSRPCMAVIRCTCESITVRSLPLQAKPYRPLAEVQASGEVRFDREGVSGTLAALYCPDGMKDVNAPGWHMHFVTDGHDAGGHVMKIRTAGAAAVFTPLEGYTLVPPAGAGGTAASDDDIRRVEG